MGIPSLQCNNNNVLLQQFPPVLHQITITGLNKLTITPFPSTTTIPSTNNYRHTTVTNIPITNNNGPTGQMPLNINVSQHHRHNTSQLNTFTIIVNQFNNHHCTTSSITIRLPGQVVTVAGSPSRSSPQQFGPNNTAQRPAGHRSPPSM